MDLLAVGRALSKQSNVDLPKTHFPSGCLPDPNKANDNSSGKKMHMNSETFYLLLLGD